MSLYTDFKDFFNLSFLVQEKKNICLKFAVLSDKFDIHEFIQKIFRITDKKTSWKKYKNLEYRLDFASNKYSSFSYVTITVTKLNLFLRTKNTYLF